jgi:Na+/H+ antiporter NhaD/arsenite permease-like protein
MIIGNAAGIDVITIARTLLVSWIAAIAILYFLSSLIVIRRPPGLYSDRTFQVANRKSFLCLLLVFIVLICPIFSFVISVFSVDGE